MQQFKFKINNDKSTKSALITGINVIMQYIQTENSYKLYIQIIKNVSQYYCIFVCERVLGCICVLCSACIYFTLHRYWLILQTYGVPLFIKS